MPRSLRVSFVLEMERGPGDRGCGWGGGRQVRVVFGTPAEGEARVLLGWEECVLPDPAVLSWEFIWEMFSHTSSRYWNSKMLVTAQRGSDPIRQSRTVVEPTQGPENTASGSVMSVGQFRAREQGAGGVQPEC